MNGRITNRTRLRKNYIIHFMLKPHTIVYSRKVMADPGVRLIDLVRRMHGNLIRQHPEYFRGIRETELEMWYFYYGYGGEQAERLDPRQSLMELGIFPGSHIVVGPASNF